MAGSPAGSGTKRRSGPQWPSFFVGPVFLSLAAWFWWGPEGVELPQGTPPTLDPGRISTKPRREVLSDPPTIEIEGALRTCSDCHRLLAPSEDATTHPVMHGHVHLEHGINDRCRNCHAANDRDKLVLYDGTVISFAESHRLCAKCHGPIYRHWEQGAHGRTNGYWDASRGEVRRLRCSECHDPHNPRVPAMDRIAPLPGPRTFPPDGHSGAAPSEHVGVLHPFPPTGTQRS